MEELKQAIVVRTDLGMGKGKIAAQVGHACVMGAEAVRKAHPDWFVWWLDGQKKIVLKVGSEAELVQIKRAAAEIGLPWCEVTDAGHTQVAPGTLTCVGLGPAPEELVDRIAGELDLL